MRAGWARWAGCWRKQELRIGDRVGDRSAGRRRSKLHLRYHHDLLRAVPIDARAPSEEGSPNGALTIAERNSHAVVRRHEAVVRRHEEDARRAGRSSRSDVAAAESVV